MRLLSLCLLVLLSALATPTTAANWVRQANWIAACDQQRACRAYGLAEPWHTGNRETDVYLMIDRTGEAGARPVLTFRSWVTSKQQTWTIKIDGRPIPGWTRRKADYVVADPEDPNSSKAMVVKSDEANIGALLDAIRTGRVLEIDRKGWGRKTINLATVSQALAFIDRAQHRTGTRQALLSPGEADETQPPIAPLPTVRPAPIADQEGVPDTVPASVLALHNDPTCRQYRRPPVPTLFNRRLAPGLILWAPDCTSMEDGAVEFRQAFIGDEDGGLLRPAIRPPPPGVDADWRPPPVRGYDINGFLWTQGFEACGDAYYWAWTGDAFALVEAQLALDCDGVAMDDRFTYYRTILDPPGP